MYLIERDDEGRSLPLEHVDALDGLLLQPVHQIDHEDGDIAQRGPPVPQVSEGLVARGVDHQQAWEQDLERVGPGRKRGEGAG